jgi:hypothetical protein
MAGSIRACKTYYEGYSESNLYKMPSEKKKLLYTKNMYILKLLLSIVTAGIEALVVSGYKFCMPVSSLPHFDTFHQLLIIVEVL